MNQRINIKEEKQYIDPEILFTSIHETLQDGYQASFTVTGMSMRPFLVHGRDHVILELPDLSHIKCGDVVLFKVPIYNNYILHRITKIKGSMFQTTGDGNNHRDGWYPMDCIEAKAVKYIRKGRTIDCEHPLWKIIIRIWMLLYPIRKLGFGVCHN